MNHLILFMGTAGGGGGTGNNPSSFFIVMILIIIVMYFFMLRPQAKRQKEHKAMLASLEKGDKILTTGGIVGTIAGIRETDSILIVKIADNVKIELSRGSVAQVIKKK